MDEQFLQAMVRIAGLELALRDFREDVVAAASEALAKRGGFVEPADPAAEPWPPMQPGTRL